MIKKLSPEDLRQHKGISFVGVSTCFFCYDGKGKFFMAKRSNLSRDEKGTWEIGGGGLKWGLTAEENVRREVVEEYGAKILKVQFLGYRDVLRQLKDSPPTHWVALDFAILVDPKSMKINEPDMFDDAGWFTLDNLPSPLHSQQHAFFKQYDSLLAPLIAKSAKGTKAS